MDRAGKPMTETTRTHEYWGEWRKLIAEQSIMAPPLQKETGTTKYIYTVLFQLRETSTWPQTPCPYAGENTRCQIPEKVYVWVISRCIGLSSSFHRCHDKKPHASPASSFDSKTNISWNNRGHIAVNIWHHKLTFPQTFLQLNLMWLLAYPGNPFNQWMNPTSPRGKMDRPIPHLCGRGNSERLQERQRTCL